MIIALGSDHAAYEVRLKIAAYLSEQGHDIIDKGCPDTSSCDYPDYAAKVSDAVLKGDAERGILICGTGIGMSIAANRHPGIRAALCTSEQLAQLSRLHNNANVLCMGARTQKFNEMKAIIDIWLSSEWEGGRHAMRLDKIDALPGGN